MTNNLYSIIDLHCDLLTYLQYNKERTPYDACLPCSIPCMRQGGVRLQTMAIFTQTGPGSQANGYEQYAIFKKLLINNSDAFVAVSSEQFDRRAEAPIAIRLAIENASSVCDENSSLAESISFLDRVVAEGHRPLYMSLTWNGENRFGGGAHSDVGLKDDGKRLLDWMSACNVAIDFSHTSDVLAKDILDYIDKNRLPIRVMASHSNIRSVYDAVRNLPDDIAKELLKRQGIIGINFVRYFVGESPEIGFSSHVKKLLEWGAEDQICLGADFFYVHDVPIEKRRNHEDLFFPQYDSAASYPLFLRTLQSELGLDESTIQKIAYENAWRFIVDQ